MTTTIQISIYDWVLMEELVYEAQIKNMAEYLALTYQFNKKLSIKN
ncbi:hypothetical protein AB1K84_22090 [Mesobacillus foraminis]